MGQPSITARLSKAERALKRGEAESARALLDDVLTRFPANKRAQTLAASLPHRTPLDRVATLYGAGRFSDALALLDAEATGDDSPRAQDLRAATLRALGRPEEALALYRTALETRDSEAPLWRNTGLVLAELQKFADACDCFTMATRLAPDLVDNYIALAQALDSRGHYAEAYDALSQALARAPDNVPALNLLGGLLSRLGQPNMAQKALDHALTRATTPRDTAAVRNSLGVLASALGDKASACTHYQQAMTAEPANLPAHLNFARLHKYTAEDAHLAQLRALLQDKSLKTRDQAFLHFALFSAMDQIARGSDEAFHHLSEGNRLRRAALRYDPQTDAILFAYLTKAAAALPDVPPADIPNDSPRPLFIVGLPRSGTTLTEQILTCAEGVHGAGELTVVDNACLPLFRRLQDERRDLCADDLTALGQTLRAALTRFADGAPVIVDKMPLNFRWVPFLLTALPEARVIHIHRDPFEVLWSNYKTCFASDGNKFVYDLEDLALYHRLYSDMMQAWEAAFPTRILNLPYSDLTADLEAQTKRLTAFAGLPWSPACLSPEKATRAVLTASAHQVRKPVYNGNARAYAPYARFLSPLAEGLGLPLPISGDAAG